jgi:N-acetylmuramoyl-L-alanine amidase
MHSKTNIAFAFLLILTAGLSGCVTVPYVQQGSTPSVGRGLIPVSELAAKNGLSYDYDTLSDIVKLSGPDKDIRLVLHSLAAYANGASFYLSAPPQYQRGVILVPADLMEALSSRQGASLRPVFTIKTVVIDAGHGGKDPGALGSGECCEKIINLKVAKYLELELKKRGFRVMLTRSSDIFLELSERVEVARKNSADLFISIHANSSNSSQLSGVEVYYLSPDRFNSRERAGELAGSGVGARREMDFDTRAILWDLKLTKNYSLSVEFAQMVYAAFKNLGFEVKTPRKAPYYVLRLAYVPSVLVETGYLSNRYEAKILSKPYYQQHIARTVASAVVAMNKEYGK